jgi:hypothetical protein
LANQLVYEHTRLSFHTGFNNDFHRSSRGHRSTIGAPEAASAWDAELGEVARRDLVFQKVGEG